MRALLTGRGYRPEHLDRLARAGYDVVQRESVDAGELELLIPSITAYVLGGDERLGPELIDRADELRLISFVGTGYGDFIDVEAANRRQISIRNTPGVGSPAVTEHVVGLLLGMVRGLFAHNDSVKRHGDRVGATPELSSRHVGIVGLGDIGTRVARVLRVAFGTTVSYASRTRKQHLEEELELRFMEVPELFSAADAIVLLAPVSPETVDLVDSDRLEAAKPGLILINAAGARLVNPHALRDALVTGQVAAAAFDSYWIEPLPAVEDDPFELLRLPDARFVVTPHVAAKTHESWSRMVEQAVANIMDATAHAS